MNNNVDTLRQGIAVITQVLTKSGVVVTQKGVEAYARAGADGKVNLINLPYLPDDASVELIEAIHGYLDHEVGHALHSDFTQETATKSQLARQLHNIIEDAYVERKMAEMFKGSAYNIGRVGEFYRKTFVDEVIKEDDAKKTQAALMVTGIRSLCGQDDYTRYMEGKWHHVQALKDKAWHLRGILSSTNNSKDCADAADALFKALHEKESEAEKPQKPKSQESEPEDSESKEPEDSEDDDSEDDELKESEPEESEDDDSEDDESQESEPEESEESEPEESEDDDSEDDESQESEPEESEPEESEPEESEPEESQESEPEESEPEESESEESQESEESEPEDDDSEYREYQESEAFIGKMDGDYSSAILKAAKSCAEDSDYLIYTDEYDVIGHPEKTGFCKLATSAEIAEFERGFDNTIQVITKAMERAITANSASTHVGGFTSGKINQAALAQMITGNQKVFKRKQVNTTKEVDVSLVVDLSGSMYPDKINVAMAGAYLLSKALSLLKINHEVIGFTTDILSCERMNELLTSQTETGLVYARLCALSIVIMKAFGEPFDEKVKARMVGSQQSLNAQCGSNVDGESIMIAAKRLMRQKNSKKVMIVLSDGQPSCYTYAPDMVLTKNLIKSVLDIQNMGVNIVGIGIMTKAPEMFYPKNTYVANLKKLPEVLTTQLRSMLLKR